MYMKRILLTTLVFVPIVVHLARIKHVPKYHDDYYAQLPSIFVLMLSCAHGNNKMGQVLSINYAYNRFYSNATNSVFCLDQESAVSQLESFSSVTKREKEAICLLTTQVRLSEATFSPSVDGARLEYLMEWECLRFLFQYKTRKFHVEKWSDLELSLIGSRVTFDDLGIKTLQVASETCVKTILNVCNLHCQSHISPADALSMILENILYPLVLAEKLYILGSSTGVKIAASLPQFLDTSRSQFELVNRHVSSMILLHLMPEADKHGHRKRVTYSLELFECDVVKEIHQLTKRPFFLHLSPVSLIEILLSNFGGSSSREAIMSIIDQLHIYYCKLLRCQTLKEMSLLPPEIMENEILNSWFLSYSEQIRHGMHYEHDKALYLPLLQQSRIFTTLKSHESFSKFSMLNSRVTVTFMINANTINQSPHIGIPDMVFQIMNSLCLDYSDLCILNLLLTSHHYFQITRMSNLYDQIHGDPRKCMVMHKQCSKLGSIKAIMYLSDCYGLADELYSNYRKLWCGLPEFVHLDLHSEPGLSAQNFLEFIFIQALIYKGLLSNEISPCDNILKLIISLEKFVAFWTDSPITLYHRYIYYYF